MDGCTRRWLMSVFRNRTDEFKSILEEKMHLYRGIKEKAYIYSVPYIDDGRYIDERYTGK